MRIRHGAIILAQHKPFGMLSPSTAPMGNKRFARDLLVRKNMRGEWKSEAEPRDTPGLICCGRLDADSTGLLLWTDDDGLAQHIIGPGTNVEKEYLVRVSGHESWEKAQREDSLSLLREGIVLDGKPLLPSSFGWLNESQLRVVLREGRHRQIRRMCAIAGLQVTGLKRVRIGQLRLQGLKTGFFTSLSPGLAAKALGLSGSGTRPR
jgi:23S rRNA pseudouridine2604 synthase